MNRRKTIALNWSDSLSCEAQAEGRKGNRAEIYCVRWPKDRTKSAVFLAVFLCLNSCTIHQTINITIMTKQKKQITFYNKYNRHNYNSKGWTTDKPSQTSQGEALSMAEIIRKFTRGEIPPLAEAAFHGRNIDINAHSGSRPPEDYTEVTEELKALRAAQNDRSSVRQSKATKRGSVAEESQSGAQPNEETAAVSGEGDGETSPKK